MNAITKISSFIVVLLFVYTGLAKLLGHDLFVEQLSQIAFLKNIAQPVSILLPLTEIATGLLIAIRRTGIYGWLLAAILMTAFTIYVGGMLLAKSKLPCTCGGVIAALSWKEHFAFNIFFMAVTWFQFMYSYSKKKSDTRE
jgi:putative oxidoreductase